MFLLDSCSPEQALGIRLQSIQDIISQVLKKNTQLLTVFPKKIILLFFSCQTNTWPHLLFPVYFMEEEHVCGNKNECRLSHIIQISLPVSVSGQALPAGAGAAQC